MKFIHDFMCSEDLQMRARNDIENWLRALSCPPKLIFDCGANVGTYALTFAELTDAKVFAFEPIIDSYQKLEANIALNDLGGRVSAINFGLWKNDCEMLMGQPRHRDSINTGLYSIFHASGKNAKLAKFINAQSAIEQYGVPQLLKLDIEGAEYDVLTAMSNDTFTDIDIIVVEKNQAYPYESVNTFLTKQSFTCKHINSSRPSCDVVWKNARKK